MFKKQACWPHELKVKKTQKLILSGEKIYSWKSMFILYDLN